MKAISYRTIVGQLLVLLFITYLGGIIGNYHVNIVNGRLVAHAHLYAHLDDEGGGSHTHTEEELLQLDQLSHIQVGSPILPAIEVDPLLYFSGKLSAVQEQTSYTNEIQTWGLRAPPAVLV